MSTRELEKDLLVSLGKHAQSMKVEAGAVVLVDMDHIRQWDNDLGACPVESRSKANIVVREIDLAIEREIPQEIPRDNLSYNLSLGKRKLLPEYLLFLVV
jgi:hypothetical protein